ncbi:MAG: hypothetical protein ACRELD_10925 [Longimicrobiales bacterium]
MPRLELQSRTPNRAPGSNSRLANTVGLGLLAVAALALTLLTGRSRAEQPVMEATLAPDGAAPAPVELDAIRAAGL